jgi:hypothetical protein
MNKVVPDSYLPGWLILTTGTAIAVTMLAAAARKPPLRWVGHWFAWVFRRLVGEPVAAFADRHFKEQVLPVVESKLVPVVESLDHLHDCVENVKGEVIEIRSKQDEMIETLAGQDISLRNIQQATVNDTLT